MSGATSFTSVPIVDISGLRSPDRAQREQVAGEIGKAAREVGFFYVSGAEVDDALFERMLAATKEFFALPLDEKMRSYIGLSKCHRGYVPAGEEGLATGMPEMKEAFDTALDHRFHDGPRAVLRQAQEISPSFSEPGQHPGRSPPTSNPIGRYRRRTAPALFKLHSAATNNADSCLTSRVMIDLKRMTFLSIASPIGLNSGLARIEACWASIISLSSTIALSWASFLVGSAGTLSHVPEL